MTPRVDNEQPEDVARRLMRDGLGDDQIERLTGVTMIRLLAIRARAAVEERAAPAGSVARRDPDEAV